jgi:hypothetical protein
MLLAQEDFFDALNGVKAEVGHQKTANTQQIDSG